jgi:hypothetical protein
LVNATPASATVLADGLVTLMVIVVVPLSARFVGANKTETEGATATVKEAEAAVPVTVGADGNTGASVVLVNVPGTPV